jgi:hypothetical protein
MKFLDIKKILTIGKIISFSLLIFFWDLNVNNIDFRLVVFFLLFITLIDKDFSSLKKNLKSFYFVLLLLLFITVHFYLNLIFDDQSIIFFPKDLIYILVTVFVIFFNLVFIRKNLGHIIFFFIFCFIIFTLINFLWTDYNILLNIYDRGLLLSCSYHGGWHGYTRFFFSENSHLAMMSVPILLYYFLGFSLNKLNYVKKFFFFFFFLSSIINYTLTFLVGMILCILSVSFSNIKYLWLEL